jgi:hypothetical protein
MTDPVIVWHSWGERHRRALLYEVGRYPKTYDEGWSNDKHRFVVASNVCAISFLLGTPFCCRELAVDVLQRESKVLSWLPPPSSETPILHTWQGWGVFMCSTLPLGEADVKGPPGPCPFLDACYPEEPSYLFAEKFWNEHKPSELPATADQLVAEVMDWKIWDALRVLHDEREKEIAELQPKLPRRCWLCNGKGTLSK